jgi:uncharacterized membrane protein
MTETAHERSQREAREAKLAEIEKHNRILLEKEEAEERANYIVEEVLTYDQLLYLLIGTGILPNDTKELLPIENLGTHRGLKFSALRYYPLSDIETGAVIDRLTKNEPKPEKKPINVVEKPTLTTDEMLDLVKKTISERDKVVADVRAGKIKAVEALVGSVMSKYKADAKEVRELFLKEIGNENSNDQQQ